jgi:tellurite resistance protein
VLFDCSLAVWAALTFAYFVGGVRGPGTFADDRRHAIYGVFAAYIPIVGTLLAAHYERYAHTGD